MQAPQVKYTPSYTHFHCRQPGRCWHTCQARLLRRILGKCALAAFRPRGWRAPCQCRRSSPQLAAPPSMPLPKQQGILIRTWVLRPNPQHRSFWLDSNHTHTQTEAQAEWTTYPESGRLRAWEGALDNLGKPMRTYWWLPVTGWTKQNQITGMQKISVLSATIRAKNKIKYQITIERQQSYCTAL